MEIINIIAFNNNLNLTVTITVIITVVINWPDKLNLKLEVANLCGIWRVVMSCSCPVLRYHCLCSASLP